MLRPQPLGDLYWQQPLISNREFARQKEPRRVLVQLAYAIGVADPVSVMVDSYGTGVVSDEALANCAQALFPTKPAELITHLSLKKPIFQATAAYGHFGRPEFTWEKTDKVSDVKAHLGL